MSSKASYKLTSKQQVEHSILYKSLVGRAISIVDSKNKNQVGLSGILVNETANFFVIAQKGSNVRILKKNIVFKLMHKGKALYIDGDLLLHTLTSRIKKLK